MRFDDTLRFGQAGESAIARWLRGRGYTVMPIYEKLIDDKQGPRLFLPNNRRLIAPDMLVWNKRAAFFVEAKHKSAFSWYRIGNTWVTGIDLRHYHEYLLLDDLGPPRVILMFLHRGGRAKDSPPDSPRGLFGGWLHDLRKKESHRSPKHGPSGMVYWSKDSLKLLATLDEVEGIREVAA